MTLGHAPEGATTAGRPLPQSLAVGAWLLDRARSDGSSRRRARPSADLGPRGLRGGGPCRRGARRPHRAPGDGRRQRLPHPQGARLPRRPGRRVRRPGHRGARLRGPRRHRRARRRTGPRAQGGRTGPLAAARRRRAGHRARGTAAVRGGPLRRRLHRRSLVLDGPAVSRSDNLGRNGPAAGPGGARLRTRRRGGSRHIRTAGGGGGGVLPGPPGGAPGRSRGTGGSGRAAVLLGP
ncbi:hypothetical protein SBADM41S_07996 [Streptomyces badius]